jgi:hypothetical protein
LSIKKQGKIENKGRQIIKIRIENKNLLINVSTQFILFFVNIFNKTNKNDNKSYHIIIVHSYF